MRDGSNRPVGGISRRGTVNFMIPWRQRDGCHARSRPSCLARVEAPRGNAELASVRLGTCVAGGSRGLHHAMRPVARSIERCFGRRLGMTVGGLSRGW